VPRPAAGRLPPTRAPPPPRSAPPHPPGRPHLPGGEGGRHSGELRHQRRVHPPGLRRAVGGGECCRCTCAAARCALPAAPAPGSCVRHARPPAHARPRRSPRHRPSSRGGGACGAAAAQRPRVGAACSAPQPPCARAPGAAMEQIPGAPQPPLTGLPRARAGREQVQVPVPRQPVRLDRQEDPRPGPPGACADGRAAPRPRRGMPAAWASRHERGALQLCWQRHGSRLRALTPHAPRPAPPAVPGAGPRQRRRGRQRAAQHLVRRSVARPGLSFIAAVPASGCKPEQQAAGGSCRGCTSPDLRASARACAPRAAALPEVGPLLTRARVPSLPQPPQERDRLPHRRGPLVEVDGAPQRRRDAPRVGARRIFRCVPLPLIEARAGAPPAHRPAGRRRRTPAAGRRRGAARPRGHGPPAQQRRPDMPRRVPLPCGVAVPARPRRPAAPARGRAPRRAAARRRRERPCSAPAPAPPAPRGRARAAPARAPDGPAPPALGHDL
jgi:hypothetical protein